MKIEEGIKMKGCPYWIPKCNRKELPKFLKSIGFNKGVEVGIAWGKNLVDYAKEGLDIHGIDTWPKEYVYQHVIELTKEYPNCQLIRKPSFEAAEDFKKRSLDFVYIDASHEFGWVAMDLHVWADKVRKGGIIAGHDYYSTTGNRGLRQVGIVVDAFVEANDIENFWVLGSPEDAEKDRELSFLFFKHW